MFNTFIRLAFFSIILWRLLSFPVYAIEIPPELPNVFDPGQLQKNIQSQNVTQKTQTLPSVENKAVPHALIQGGEKIYFQLNKVIITGNTVLTDEELQSIFASSLHKKISVADLQSLIQAVTTRYRDKGYILSRAILPPQEIKNGVVKIEIVEGFISTVTVTGNPAGARKLIEEYGQHIVQSKPLNIAVMQHEMLLMNDIPGIFVKALILPSKTVPDAADLTLVADHKLITASLEQDNYGTRYIGPIQSSLSFSANSIFVSGDATGGNATVTTKVSE